MTPPEESWESAIPTLDLHGETAAAAIRRVRVWLEEQRRSGEPNVRIITGRGLHSAGTPVLRGEVEALLRTLAPGVRRWTSEAAGGAFRVELMLPRLAPRREREGEVSHDPTLLRRAEESLWELGIIATPELVRAEMRRLRGTGERD